MKCIKLERGYFTQHFITNQKYKTCVSIVFSFFLVFCCLSFKFLVLYLCFFLLQELDDPLIFIHDKMVSNVQAIKVLELAITVFSLLSWIAMVSSNSNKTNVLYFCLNRKEGLCLLKGMKVSIKSTSHTTLST